MSFYDPEYYQEPSEFEQMVEEFKSALAGSIKDEHTQKIDQLTRENAEMREKLKNLSNLETEANLAKRKAEMDVVRAKEEARQEFRKARAMEVLAELTEPRWRLHQKPHQKPKCDQCDNQRWFHFKSPQGRDMSERCVCSECTYTWEVEEVAVKEVAKRNGSMMFWYMATRAWETDRDYDRGEHFSSDALKPADKASDDQIMDNPTGYGFTDQERCQSIAEKLQEARKARELNKEANK